MFDRWSPMATMVSASARWSLAAGNRLPRNILVWSHLEGIIAMKKYSISLLESQFQELLLAAREDGSEMAAFLYCNRAESELESKLLVTDIELVEPVHILSRDDNHLTLKSACYANAFSRGHAEGKSVIFLHSHPGGYPQYSDTDQNHDATMFPSAYACAPDGLHGSAILVDGENPHIIAQIWESSGRFIKASRIRVVGLQRLRIFDRGVLEISEPSEWADRQIRALGPEGQKLLSKLRVGVIGAGGTGSPLCAQLIKLGISFTVVDPDVLEITNVNRVFGATVDLAKQGISKVDLVALLANESGLPVTVTPIQRSTLEEEATRALLDCDIVFGCSDDHLGRSILSRLALWYYIPVIDIGLAFPSENGKMIQVIGRMTKLVPGSACLECHGVVSQNHSLAEHLRATNIQEYHRQRALGYVPELAVPNPSVVSFTCGIAARAINELLELVTGFMDRTSEYSTLQEIYSEPALYQSNVKPRADCWCADRKNWGAGDTEQFLGIGWLRNDQVIV